MTERCSKRTDLNGNVTTYTHDARGDETWRTEAAETALPRTSTTAWLVAFTCRRRSSHGHHCADHAHGNLQKKTVAAGSLTRSWAYTYNAAGQVLTMTDPLGHVTAYTYDATGDVATVKDALGHVTTFTG